MNLAGVLPWTYVRAFGVIALLVLGISFACRAPSCCPGTRAPAGSGSSQVAALAAQQVDCDRVDDPFLLVLRAFAIWDHPARTAWLLIAYFAAAFVVDTFFRGASFCKYLCPLDNSISPAHCFRPSP